MSKKLIEQLHPVGFATQVKRIEELKRANQHLIMALADAEALEIGTAEQCDALQADRDEWKASAEFSYRQRDELNRLYEFNEKTMSALLADNARLREALEYCFTQVGELASVPGIASALSSIPEQSLAEYRNKAADRIEELERERDTAWAQAHRLALELECLIMDTKDNAVVSKWWDSAFEAIEEYQSLKPGADEESEAWAKMRKVGI